MSKLTFYVDRKSAQQGGPLPSHVVFHHQNTGFSKPLRGLELTSQQSDGDGVSDGFRQFFTHARESDSLLGKLRTRFHQWRSLYSNNTLSLEKMDFSNPISFDSTQLNNIQKIQHSCSTMLHTLPADKTMAKTVVAKLDAQLILIQHILRRLSSPSSQLSKTQKHTIRKLNKAVQQLRHCHEEGMRAVELLETIEVDCQALLAKARIAQLIVVQHAAVGMQDVKNATE
ncbi:MAG: hypothetical protein Q9209_000840 [Squamulea sp. 1 TL-2023]